MGENAVDAASDPEATELYMLFLLKPQLVNSVSSLVFFCYGLHCSWYLTHLL